MATRCSVDFVPGAAYKQVLLCAVWVPTSAGLPVKIISRSSFLSARFSCWTWHRI